MKVILDAGPIIALAKTGQLGILPKLFDDVIVPSTVMREVAPRGETRPGVEIRRAPWARVARVSRSRVRLLEQAFDIDPGEAAAILLAEDEPSSSVVLMDDRKGLAAARARGVHAIRTGALMVHAVDERILTEPAVVTALSRLRVERYLSAAAEIEILRLLKGRKR